MNLIYYTGNRRKFQQFIGNICEFSRYFHTYFRNLCQAAAIFRLLSEPTGIRQFPPVLRRMRSVSGIGPPLLRGSVMPLRNICSQALRARLPCRTRKSRTWAREGRTEWRMTAFRFPHLPSVCRMGFRTPSARFSHPMHFFSHAPAPMEEPLRRSPQQSDFCS